MNLCHRAGAEGVNGGILLAQLQHTRDSLMSLAASWKGELWVLCECKFQLPVSECKFLFHEPGELEDWCRAAMGLTWSASTAGGKMPLSLLVTATNLVGIS